VREEQLYFIEPHEDEAARLALRHRVWRPSVLELWQSAGIGSGMTVIDACAGPGHAAFDLAGLVGAQGRVIGMERPKGFARTMAAEARAHGLSNLAVMEVDIARYAWPTALADAVWSCWGLNLARDPGLLVDKIARALKPGGTAIFQEYYDYESWRLAPHSTAFEIFVSDVADFWREGGRDLDVGLTLPRLLEDAGLRIETYRPVVFATRPSDIVWKWPSMGARHYAPVLVDAGVVAPDTAETICGILDEYEADPASLMLTPGVLQIVARKSR
jgi:SAM-dependent methyltransferase